LATGRAVVSTLTLPRKLTANSCAILIASFSGTSSKPLTNRMMPGRRVSFGPLIEN